MRKSKMIIAAAFLTAFSHNAGAATVSFGAFEDGSSFVIAKTVKLGRNTATSQQSRTFLASPGETSVVDQQITRND